MPLPGYEYHFRRLWQIKSADQDDQDQDQQDDPNAVGPDQMQTLNTGTAQQLCERLWKGFITNDMSQFSAFFQQVDQVATNFLQSLPVPVPEGALEDADFNEADLPSIGPQGKNADEE